MSTSLSRHRPFSERLAEWLVKASGVLATSAVFAILFFVAHHSWPLLSFDGLSQLATWDWAPYRNAHGILPMLLGSVTLAALALALAFPWALGICTFAHGLAPEPLGRWLLAAIRFMTSIPTIIYAFASATLLPPLLRGTFERGNGFCLLAAALTLSVLILPTVVLLIDAWWRSAEPALRQTCCALGLTKPQALLFVLIPASRKALLAAAVLGLGRALGDTMIALLLSGNAPQVPGSLLDSIRTLTAHVAMAVEMDTTSVAYRSVFAAGLLLLLTTATLNLGVRWVVGRTRGRSDAKVAG